MTRRVWRVSPHDGSWQVKRDGAARATRAFSGKRAATTAARELARANPPSRLVIHGSDGTVQTFADYGEGNGLSYAGSFDGPADLGLRSEKYLAEHFSQPDAGS